MALYRSSLRFPILLALSYLLHSRSNPFYDSYLPFSNAVMGGHGHSSHRHGHHRKSSRNHSSGLNEWYGRESSQDLAPFQNTHSHHKKHRSGSHDEYGWFDHDPMSEFLDYTDAAPSTGYSPRHPPLVMHNDRSHRTPCHSHRPFKQFSEDAYLGAIPSKHDPYAKHDIHLGGVAAEQSGRTLHRSHFDESSYWSSPASHHSVSRPYENVLRG